MYTVFTEGTHASGALPKRSSLVNFSLFRQLYCPVPFRSFSIKYVGAGCENYMINGNKYQVCSGNYLLANHYSEGHIEIDSKSIVKGICIDIAPELLSEVVASFRRPDSAFPDPELDIFFDSSQFLENKYRIDQTHTGKFLKLLDIELSENPYENKNFSKEFYFNLAEKIVWDHIPVYKQLQSVPGLRSSTKKDLLRKVTKGKEFIDLYFKNTFSILTVANESNLSEYHFYRLFRSVFGISPKQYIVKKRMEYATEKLAKENTSISEIATESGFSDIHSFSKSFKKQTGTPPSVFLEQQKQAPEM